MANQQAKEGAITLITTPDDALALKQVHCHGPKIMLEATSACGTPDKRGGAGGIQRRGGCCGCAIIASRVE